MKFLQIAVCESGSREFGYEPGPESVRILQQRRA
jgi:hypothetical protein